MRQRSWRSIVVSVNWRFVGAWLATMILIWTSYAIAHRTIVDNMERDLEQRLETDTLVLEDHASRVLEGVVTNVAAFGAFVDVGVHQDGLVHISAMSRTFVKDPRSVAKPGDVVRVKVMEVDVARKRIALTMRLDDEPGATPAPRRASAEPVRVQAAPQPRPAPAPAGAGGALAEALRKAQDKGRGRD
jgi:transcriptional accessory protein Tex/SPT6